MAKHLIRLGLKDFSFLQIVGQRGIFMWLTMEKLFHERTCHYQLIHDERPALFF
jgi:hypothetical protein